MIDSTYTNMKLKFATTISEFDEPFVLNIQILITAHFVLINFLKYSNVSLSDEKFKICFINIKNKTLRKFCEQFSQSLY